MSAARDLVLGIEADVNDIPRAARLLQAALTSDGLEADPEAVLWAVGEIIAMGDRVLRAVQEADAATSPPPSRLVVNSAGQAQGGAT